MPNAQLQRDQKLRACVIYALRMIEQGIVKPSKEWGICSNLREMAFVDMHRRLSSFEWMKTLGIPDPDHDHKRSRHICDFVSWVAAEYWPHYSGNRTYPIPGGQDEYLLGQQLGILWLGIGGHQRRELCGLLADVLEREEV